MILGIDSSTKAIHIAVFENDGTFDNFHSVGSQEKTAEKRLYDLWDKLYALFECISANYSKDKLEVFLEDSIYIQNPYSSIALAKVVAMVQLMFYGSFLEVSLVPNRLWKKEIVGNGAAQKNQIKKFAEQTLGREIKDQNFCDSFCIGLYGIKKMKSQKSL